MDNKQILERLAKQVGLALAQTAMIYLPALKRLAMAELVAFIDALSTGERDKATKLLQAKMTEQELADEKVALADLAVRMADENAEKRRIAKAIGVAILKATVGALSLGAFL